MEVRKPGNPGGTRGSANAPYVSQPRHMPNSSEKAPGGEVKQGEVRQPTRGSTGKKPH